MTELIMALQALSILNAALPGLMKALADIVSAIKLATSGTQSTGEQLNEFNTIVADATAVLASVSGMTFSVDSPISQAIGVWNSAFATVYERAKVRNPGIDPAVVRSAMQLASHTADVDTPLDVLPTTAGNITIPEGPKP